MKTFNNFWHKCSQIKISLIYTSQMYAQLINKTKEEAQWGHIAHHSNNEFIWAFK